MKRNAWILPVMNRPFIYRGHRITTSKLAHNHYLIVVRHGSSQEQMEITCTNHSDVSPEGFARSYVDTILGVSHV